MKSPARDSGFHVLLKDNNGVTSSLRTIAIASGNAHVMVYGPVWTLDSARRLGWGNVGVRARP